MKKNNFKMTHQTLLRNTVCHNTFSKTINLGQCPCPSFSLFPCSRQVNGT